ncbi:MAG: hypothetical protein AAF711_00490 [Planctomycetota bacterium]
MKDQTPSSIAIAISVLLPFLLVWPAVITSGVFFVLRLTDHIAWTWWWVFSPLLILSGLIVFLGVICSLAFFVTAKDRTPAR